MTKSFRYKYLVVEYWKSFTAPKIEKAYTDIIEQRQAVSVLDSLSPPCIPIAFEKSERKATIRGIRYCTREWRW